MRLQKPFKLTDMKNISFEDFRKKLSYNDYTAFVYNDGTQQMYSGGQINDDSIQSFEDGGQISICNMGELPDIKQLMQENLLAEFMPAPDVVDEGYQELEKQFEENQGEIAFVDNNGTTTYMLVW